MHIQKPTARHTVGGDNNRNFLLIASKESEGELGYLEQAHKSILFEKSFCWITLSRNGGALIP